MVTEQEVFKRETELTVAFGRWGGKNAVGGVRTLEVEFSIRPSSSTRGRTTDLRPGIDAPLCDVSGEPTRIAPIAMVHLLHTSKVGISHNWSQTEQASLGGRRYVQVGSHQLGFRS